MKVISNQSQESSTKVRSYRDLIAWQKSMDLIVTIYKATETFPKAEQFGLISQLRRAAVSVPSNIAEGSSRRSRPEFIRFVNIANGSLAEIETQITAALRLSLSSKKPNSLFYANAMKSAESSKAYMIP